MATTPVGKNGTIVISALQARANFGKLLRRVDDERRSLVIEKRGTPKAVLLSIRDYVRLAAPEPEVLRALGQERRGTARVPLPPASLPDYQGFAALEAQTVNASLRLVIDTNVLISAALKPAGLQRTVVLLAMTKPARWYVSRPISRSTVAC